MASQQQRRLTEEQIRLIEDCISQVADDHGFGDVTLRIINGRLTYIVPARSIPFPQAVESDKKDIVDG